MLGGLAFRVDDLAPDHGERLLHGGEAAGGAGAGDGDENAAKPRVAGVVLAWPAVDRSIVPLE